MTSVCDTAKMAVNMKQENDSFSDGQSSLEDSSVVSSSHHQSWYDMMEEEEAQEEIKITIKKDSLVAKDEPEDDLYDEVFASKTEEVKETIVKSETSEKIVTEVKTTITTKLEPKKEPLFSDILKRRLQSYSKKSPIKSPLKLEENSNDSQGLISDLMNNIDGFHMITPIKQDDKVENKLPEPIKLKGLDSEDEDGDEDVLNVHAEEEEEDVKDEEGEGEVFIRIDKPHPFRKRVRDSSSSSHADSDKMSDFSPKRKKRHYEKETDPVILARRQKQIDYGKNTIGYDRYIQAVPRYARTKNHPKTPPKHVKYSRRAWDGIVKVWRQQLHEWDSPNQQTADSGKESCSDLSSTLTASNGSEPKANGSSDSEEQSLDDSLLADDGFSDM